MLKSSFFNSVLFSLVMFGFGLELTSPYLDTGLRYAFVCSDLEQEQEDYNGHTKPAKNDEDRQFSIFWAIEFPTDTETRRRQAPDYCERALPPAFLSIFSPPPEQCIACDIA